MPGNKNLHDKRDSIKADSNDPSEVEYLHRQYPKKTHDEIKDTIKKYGPYRKDIERYLSAN